MSHESVRITWRRPLAMLPLALEEDLAPRGVAPRGFSDAGDAAVVTIRGPLMQRASGFWSLFCDDYESIRERVGEALASPASRTILRIDSPGGDASGCLELARELRAMATAAGKKLVVFGEGVVASAAFAIGTAATPGEFYIQPTTFVGSVGCITQMVDCTGMDRAMGVVYTLIASGIRKTDGNPHAPTTEEAVARTQAKIDQLADLFFGVVTDHRGVPVEKLRALEGEMLVGESAVVAGLADHVSAWADVLAGKTPSPRSAAMADKPDPEEKKDAKASAKEHLRAIVDDEKADKGDRESARKALRALEAEPPEEDEGDKDKEARAAADKKDEEMRAAAAASVRAGAAPPPAAAAPRAVVDVQAAVAAELDKRQRVQAEATEVKELLATRPDFDAAMKAALGKLPVAEVREVVKSSPRRAFNPAAAGNASPTLQGETQGDYQLAALPADVEDLLNRRMGNTGATAPDVKTASISATFDFDRAREHVKKLDAQKASR